MTGIHSKKGNVVWIYKYCSHACPWSQMKHEPRRVRVVTISRTLGISISQSKIKCWECNSIVMSTWTILITCSGGVRFEYYKRLWLLSLDNDWFSDEIVKSLILRMDKEVVLAMNTTQSISNFHELKTQCLNFPFILFLLKFDIDCGISFFFNP